MGKGKQRRREAIPGFTSERDKIMLLVVNSRIRGLESLLVSLSEKPSTATIRESAGM